jgi:hypothetical protein
MPNSVSASGMAPDDDAVADELAASLLELLSQGRALPAFVASPDQCHAGRA